MSTPRVPKIPRNQSAIHHVPTAVNALVAGVCATCGLAIYVGDKIYVMHRAASPLQDSCIPQAPVAYHTTCYDKVRAK